jgi:hypothetical protein
LTFCNVWNKNIVLEFLHTCNWDNSSLKNDLMIIKYITVLVIKNDFSEVQLTFCNVWNKKSVVIKKC